MYDSYYINMIHPLSRPRLEQLASAAVFGSSLQQVNKVNLGKFLTLVTPNEDDQV